MLQELNVPVNAYTDVPVKASDILQFTFKDRDPFTLIENVYLTGMVDDVAFEGQKSIDAKEIKTDKKVFWYLLFPLSYVKTNFCPTGPNWQKSQRHLTVNIFIRRL